MTVESEELILEAWEGHEGLRSILPAWSDLSAQLPSVSLCNSPEWVLCHAQAFADSRTVFGWVARRSDGELVAVLPFREEPARGALALRRAILLQDGTFDSDYLELPIRPGHELATLRSTLAALRSRSGLQAAVFSCIPVESPQYSALHALLDELRLPHRESSAGCCAAELPSTLDEYIGSLKKRMRSKVRSSMRRTLERGAEFVWCHDPVRLAEDLEGLYELHAMRWKEAGEEGSFHDEGRRRFYAELMPRLLEQGTLRFARLDIDGKPAAYQIGAVYGGTYYQLQEGYHTDYADIRVGTALRGMFAETLIEEGVRSYDFMAGLSTHKNDWGAKERACQTLAFPLPGRPRARLAYLARQGMDRWRRRTGES